jgi:hypothetical protein
VGKAWYCWDPVRTWRRGVSLGAGRPRSRQYWLRGERGGLLAKRWNLVVPEFAGALLGD